KLLSSSLRPSPGASGGIFVAPTAVRRPWSCAAAPTWNGQHARARSVPKFRARGKRPFRTGPARGVPDAKIAASSARGRPGVPHRACERGPAVRVERVCSREAVALVLVLREFAFRDDALDRDLDAHDAREHLVEVLRRGVADLPGVRIAGARLVAAREPGDDAANEAFVVANAHAAVDVDDAVVPGRHLAVRFVLARIPVGREVPLLGAED